MAFYRSDQGRIQVSVTGVSLDLVAWDTFTGGDLTAEAAQYNPGNMAPQIALGGLRKRGDITVTRAWSDVLYAVYVQLDSAAGSTPMSVVYTPLNINKTVTAKPVTYTGILSTVNRPDYEAATSSVSYLSLTMSANESLS